MTILPLTESELADVRKRHEHTNLEIQNNFGAAYSSRITDSYQIHQDRAALLATIAAEKARADNAELLGAQIAAMLECQAISRECSTLVWDVEKLNAVVRVLPTAARELLERVERAEAAAFGDREKLANWMMRAGYATGHGYTISDLLEELYGQHKKYITTLRASARTPGTVEVCNMCNGRDFKNGGCDYSCCPI